jgi:hypothetical protein
MQTHHQSITYLDMEGGGEPTPHESIKSIDELRTKLSQLAKQEPKLVEFKSAAGDRLQLGIGGPFACVQFLKQDNLPPYLCAKTQTFGTNRHIEFICGGTPSPIPPELCLSFHEAAQIAEYFYETGNRDPNVEWVEV